MAAGHGVSPERWLAGLDDLLGLVGARVGRVEPRKRLRQFVIGITAGLPRVNCWTLLTRTSCSRAPHRRTETATAAHSRCAAPGKRCSPSPRTRRSTPR